MNESMLRRLGWAVLVNSALMGQAAAQGDSDLDAILGPSESPTESTPPASAPATAEAAPAPAASEPAPAATAPQAAAEPATGEAVAPEAAASGPRTVKNRLTEEIVVTAEKREENLQEVPTSVSAFSGAALDAKGVADIKDLQLITPGLQYDSMASYSIIFIRGIGGDAFQAGVDSSVATYIDGLYLPFTFSAAQALGDVKQIEVLKGPQGSLYGRNAIAGAITIKLKEPTKDFAASVLAQYGNYNDAKTKISVSGPVPFTDQSLLYSASFVYQNRDSYTTNFFDPNEPDYHSYRNRGYRGALQWDPIDDMQFGVAFYDLKSQDPDSVATNLLTVAPLFKAVLTPNTEKNKSGNVSSIGVFARTRIFSAYAENKMSDYFDAKLIYGKTAANSTILFDYDSAPEPVLDISAVPNRANSESFELIFTSSAEATPDWLEYVGGFYYESTKKTGRYPATIDPLAYGLNIAGSAVLGSPPVLCQIYANIGGDCSANADTNKNILVNVPIYGGVANKAKSFYGQLTFHITEKFSVVAGGRASREDTKLLFAGVGVKLVIPQLGGGVLTTPQLNAIQYAPQQKTFQSFTPTVGLNYKLTDDILLYYKYSEAFKSGNYNGLNINNPPTRVEPELASSNELGFKSSLLEDRSLKLNGAAFLTTISNAQLQTLSLTSGGVTKLQNAGSYSVYGAEGEVNWFVTDALVLGLTGVYLKGTYNNFTGQGFNDLYLNQNNIDFSGKTTVRTPKFTGTASANYTFPFFFGLDAELAGDVYYTSGFYYTANNSLEQPSYYLLNARFGVYDPRSRVRVTLYGKNLNDDTYYTNAYRQDFGDTVIWANPRTYGVTVSWEYGN
ncbi:TonB-dependent receptor [Nevskia ramosa]|uniref:TonB-dependent receptor n=1 Tax=Nevskia ramosa TaxID=64002 RepID=UPI003D0E1D78